MRVEKERRSLRQVEKGERRNLVQVEKERSSLRQIEKGREGTLCS
jgi:hypothetical protein